MGGRERPDCLAGTRGVRSGYPIDVRSSGDVTDVFSAAELERANLSHFEDAYVRGWSMSATSCNPG
ncbi:hypothetical protein GCM10010151_07120 [Actinoallomurus spadix]|uniref:Uncharacterized protein n=1 Tax=Actinoallomurus spadix TaxID=79912 RepID=A0ABP3FNS1_9ACTN